jgi:hypothetical protein
MLFDPETMTAYSMDQEFANFPADGSDSWIFSFQQRLPLDDQSTDFHLRRWSRIVEFS